MLLYNYFIAKFYNIHCQLCIECLHFFIRSIITSNRKYNKNRYIVTK